MEEIIESIAGILVVAIAFLVKSGRKKNQKAVIAAHQAIDAMRSEMTMREEPKKELKAAPPAAVEKVAAPAAAKPQAVKENHQHEGKPEVPCPAVERETPRPAEQKKTTAPVIPGLNLRFDRNSVLQGVVMGEILNRPHAGMRR